MNPSITTPNLHKQRDNDMSYKETNAHMMKEVMASFLQSKNIGETKITDELRRIAEDAELIGQTSWGKPHSWYTSGKFLSNYNNSTSFINVNPERWLQLHDSIEHSRTGADQATVEWVQEQIRDNNTSEIPTPTLALEPDDYGQDTTVYTPIKEGRSRGVGAKRAGLSRIPILVSIRRPTR